MATIPDDLVDRVREGACILFLGAMSSAPAPSTSPYAYPAELAPPSGKTLASHLAHLSGYPYTDSDNLQRVSLHFELRDQTNRRNLLIQEIRKQACRDDFVPSPALHMLAALPFRIIITTNYDKLFDTALWQARTRDGKSKRPVIHVYDPTRPAADVPLDNPENKPVLLKLHGDIDDPQSIVITEEDYLHFIQRMGNEHMHPIPQSVRARMQGWPVLFVGYSLKDFNLRLLLRTLWWGRDVSTVPPSYSIDPYPDRLVVAVHQRKGSSIVTFLEVDLWEFVPELEQRVNGALPT
jgi:hypothetical protein